MAIEVWTANIIVCNETQDSATGDSPENAVRALLKSLLETGEVPGSDLIEFGKFLSEIEAGEHDTDAPIRETCGDFSADFWQIELLPAGFESAVTE